MKAAPFEGSKLLLLTTGLQLFGVLVGTVVKYKDWFFLAYQDYSRLVSLPVLILQLRYQIFLFRGPYCNHVPTMCTLLLNYLNLIKKIQNGDPPLVWARSSFSIS